MGKFSRRNSSAIFLPVVLTAKSEYFPSLEKRGQGRFPQSPTVRKNPPLNPPLSKGETFTCDAVSRVGHFNQPASLYARSAPGWSLTPPNSKAAAPWLRSGSKRSLMPLKSGFILGSV